MGDGRNLNILTGYLADMTKYAENIDAVKIHQIYRTMPAQLAKPSLTNTTPSIA